ncbi:MAG: SCO family protein [Alphaproteobacteria bacterium]|mgnify:CR=1|jgi:cytochrome oxidase Cu insertion factor (SCO1/SenC/PrrC family)|nr:SCO family protein [Alphaproteobacteria bacterium]MBT4016773.1 SCO family protein [Alphaproteobacteria bacterium]MBT5158729.1 SCO family protein [Alphaproteobacteria bacterium]MBT5917943.1 SCO family protein [Alphaproteobacteria bacterium]MBT6385662.1 SCO family protein [Alphaproteobacteria bacterium]
MNKQLIIVIVLIAAGAIGLAGRYLIMGGNDRPVGQSSSGVGKALVGGPFQMLDQNGKTVTQDTYAGKYLMVFFGYTFCPDVCPQGLQIIGSAIDIFKEQGGDADKIVPLFVTVDPERDTVEILREYLTNFHPAIQGLVGTVAQTTAMGKAYRVYYAKVKDPDSSADYLMDHTSLTYLMGPDGGYVGHFSHTATPEQIAERLAKDIK